MTITLAITTSAPALVIIMSFLFIVYPIEEFSLALHVLPLHVLSAFRVSYSTIVLYSKDHVGVGVACNRISPKTSLNSPI